MIITGMEYMWAEKHNFNIPNLNIRTMQPTDLAYAADCTAAEGWFSEDWSFIEGFYLHDPSGCLLAELSSQPVGICIATPYEESGFIGELIVRPEARGSGIGAALLNYAINYLQKRGAITIYLDGVVKAVSLYECNGFRKICRSLRFSSTRKGKHHAQIRPMQRRDLPFVYALDWQAFGANRNFFLEHNLDLFPDLCKVMVEGDKLIGFIQGRRGDGWVAVGPWTVTETAPEPLLLLESLTSEVEANPLPINFGVLETNHQAVDLFRSLGFVERPDAPWRMALGPSNDLGASSQCFAIGSPAKG